MNCWDQRVSIGLYDMTCVNPKDIHWQYPTARHPVACNVTHRQVHTVSEASQWSSRLSWS